MDFPCTACGKCCRLVGINEKTAFLNRGDGICRYFDERTNLCTIYESRPLVCRVKDYWKLYLQDKYSWDEFIQLNIAICQKL